VAVIGGGLLGVAAAASLGASGYDVTLFEKLEMLGGRLSETLDPETYLPHLHGRLEAAKCGVSTGHEVADISELDMYDAVALATGGSDGMDGANSNGVFFRQPDSSDRVFSCGIGAGEPAVLAVVRALGLAAQVQAWLKTGVTADSRPAAGTRDSCGNEPCLSESRLEVLKKLYGRTPPSPRVNAAPFDRDSSAEEAGLCMACKCEACMEACDFMRHYGMEPKTIRNNVRMNLNPMDGLKAHVATRMIFSCSACGICKEACSEGVDTGSLILFARSLMQRENDVPPVFHEFWLRDMAHADGGSSSLLRHARGMPKSSQLFFPGCQLGATEPGLAYRAYGALLEAEPETGIFLGCCGAPALWSGHESAFGESLDRIKKAWEDFGRPVFVLACPSCKRILGLRLPQIKTRSLYAALSEIAGKSPAERIGAEADAAPGTMPNTAPNATPSNESDGIESKERYAVFDPCAARSDGEAKEGVRSLLAACGHEYEELPRGEEESGCCGFGGLTYPANPELATKLGARRVAASPLPYATYCANCRDIFRRNGKACRHVLEIALPGEYGDPAVAPSLSQRRANREKLKRQLLTDFWDEGMDNEHGGLPKITYADGLQSKMDALLVLDSDVAAVIAQAESEGCQLMDSDTGDYTAHGRVGQITCWVTYRPNGEGFFVKNVYSHRMCIAGEQDA
jgi:Fe-S oxidoreductase